MILTLILTITLKLPILAPTLTMVLTLILTKTLKLPILTPTLNHYHQPYPYPYPDPDPHPHFNPDPNPNPNPYPYPNPNPYPYPILSYIALTILGVVICIAGYIIADPSKSAPQLSTYLIYLG